MRIDINTRFITLIGTPLSQSFAARMQNAGYESANDNMVYFYTEVGNDHLLRRDLQSARDPLPARGEGARCQTINGLDMSLYQGLRQIQLWTGGQCAPLDAMRQELMTIMDEQSK